MTTFNIREVHQELQQYPSVTVCPSLPTNFSVFYMDLNYILTSLPPQMILEMMKDKLKNKNETFYFVDQKTSSNEGFPCMTKRNSYDPGKPCQFPFVSRYQSRKSDKLKSK